MIPQIELGIGGEALDKLETERLLIRPFAMSDLHEAHQLLDRDLHWAGPNFSLAQRRKRLQREIYLAEWADSGGIFGYRAVLRKDSGPLIGIVGFLPSLWSPQVKLLFWPQWFGSDIDCRYASLEVEIGYALGSSYRRQGFATEAVTALLTYGSQKLHLQRVFASTNRSNRSSIALMRRIGMRVASNPDQPDVEWPNAPGVAGVIELL